MKAFQAAFVAADEGLDGKVCKNGSNGDANGTTNKCKAGDTNNDNNLGHVYKDGGPDKVDAKDAEAGANIATSLSKLSKEEKATLAAAFAKAVEGDGCMGVAGL